MYPNLANQLFVDLQHAAQAFVAGAPRLTLEQLDAGLSAFQLQYLDAKHLSEAQATQASILLRMVGRVYMAHSAERLDEVDRGGWGATVPMKYEPLPVESETIQAAAVITSFGDLSTEQQFFDMAGPGR